MLIESWVTQDVKSAVKVRYLDGNVFSQDNLGNRVGVILYDGDSEAALSGTISASVIRADGATVAVTGSSSGNRAWVDLPQSCYAVPGLISIVIKSTASSVTTTLAAVVATVYQSSTDTAVDPGTIIPSIADLIAEIEEAIASLPADWSGLWATLAPAYSTSATYQVGQLVTYNQKIYRCTADITSGETWTSSHWTEDSLGNVIFVRCFRQIRSLTEADDCDNITQTGYYYWTGTHVPAHSPTPDNAWSYHMLVFRRIASNIVQVAIPNASPNARIALRFFISTTSTWHSWLIVPYTSDIQSAIAEAEARMNVIINNLCSEFTDFENGNINASGQSSTNTHPLRSGYIHIDEFVSVDVTGDDGSGNDYNYQLFAYDSSFSYLGYGNTSYHAQPTTRADVLTAYPTAKYIRLKISGGNPNVDLNPANLASYGYTGLVCVSYDSVQRMASGEADIMSLIEANADANGQYTESFTIEFDLSNSPKILSISAQYTGDAPTIRISNRSSAGYTTIPSPDYVLGGTIEPTRKSWRIPPASAVYTHGRIVFTIPSGTVVTIRDAVLRDDQRNRYRTNGITFHGHTGSIAPANSVEAFQLGAELGYDSMITIPKILADGTGVCFHDDSSISGSLYWMDGTAITGDADKAISDYTYAYITENFRLKPLAWGVLHVPTLDDFMRVCSMTGMKPFFSVHSSPAGMWTGATGQANFQYIKNLAIKWNVLSKVGIKSGSDSIQAAARAVFGTEIDSYIFLSGQTHAPYDQLNLAKNAGFVDASATDLTGCPYNLVSEYFYTQTTPSGTYYTQTMASIATELARGFKISVAETNAISGPEMHRLINAGVTEFTVDSHISMGLDW